MKQSDAMTLLGYGALPNGPALIQEQEQREASETRMKTRNHDLPTILFSVARDFSDDSVEVAVEVLEYQSREYSGNSSAGHREMLGPYVDFGDAWYLDGRECVLTETEREAAADAAIKQIELEIAKSEEDAALRNAD